MAGKFVTPLITASEWCVERKTTASSITAIINLVQAYMVFDDLSVVVIENKIRHSNDYVERVYHLVIHQLGKEHAEIRYSAFQICDELFRRSHVFRELLVSNLQYVMEVTAETCPDRPLPPPRAVALDLKKLALRVIQEWNKEFGDGYKKLHLGFNFLKHCKKVDFNALEMENSAERERQRELERRQNNLNNERIKKINNEIK
ncbi:unnamed protein product, partial [Timema podura]|nr:unnamed protein product [Timema podura]